MRSSLLLASSLQVTLARNPVAILSLLGILALTAFHAPRSASAEELRWKFAVGDRFTVSYEQSVEQTTEVLLKPVTVETRSSVEMAWEVLSVDESGNATIKQQFKKLSLSLKSSRGDVLEFNSESDDPVSGKTSEVGKVLMPLLDAPFEVKMSPRGELLDVAVPETSLATIRQSASSMRLRQLFSGESLSETLSFIAATLPANEVNVGDSWSLERDAGSAELPFKVVHELTFERASQAQSETTAPEASEDPLADQPGDAAAARVKVVTTIVPGELSEERADGSKPAAIANQSSQGVLWFDVERGNPTRSVQVQELVTTTPLREMTIEVTAKTTTRSTVSRE